MHCIQCIIFYALFPMHCILCIVFYALYYMDLILCIALYASYYMHCILQLFFCFLNFLDFFSIVSLPDLGSVSLRKLLFSSNVEEVLQADRDTIVWTWTELLPVFFNFKVEEALPGWALTESGILGLIKGVEGMSRSIMASTWQSWRCLWDIVEEFWVDILSLGWLAQKVSAQVF